MRDEMRLHLDRATERLMARGLSPNEARREARREFGHLGTIEEEARDARGVRWIEDVVQDAKFGVRSLAQAPAFTVVALLSLVLGIGLNTTIFTAVGALLSPRAIHEPATFVSIPQTWSYPAYERLRTSAPAFSSLIVRSDERTLLAASSIGEQPARVALELVAGDYFNVLGATMVLGRPLDPEERDAPVGVLNYRFWKARFGGDSSVLGRTLRFANGASITVIGVAGQSFTGVRRGGPDVWLPLDFRPRLPAVTQGVPTRGDWFSANSHAWLTLYGRLAAGRTAGEAQAQINTALRQLAAVDSTFAPGMSRAPFAIVTADIADADDGQRSVRAIFRAATLVVLLVACFNVAGLTLARSTERRREIALRLCLGAGRARIVRQLVTESALLVTTSAVLAGLLSTWLLRGLAISGRLAFINDDDPERLAHALAPNAGVFAFAVVLAAVSVVACGLLPALSATRPDLTTVVKGRGRARRSLTVAQVALSVMLLVSAGVLTRSLARALSFELGFERARVLSVSSTLRLAGYDSVRARAIERALEQRVAALPGVQAVARGDVPIVGGRFRTTLAVNGSNHDGFLAAVTPSYFGVFDIPIVRGRAFTDEELRSRAQVVVVSEATARTLWPNDDAVGKTLRVDSRKKALTAPETMMAGATVIGVARDAQMVELGELPPVYVYLPSASGEMLVRARDADAVAPMIREAGRAVDPDLLVSVTPLSRMLAENGSLYNLRFAAGFAGLVGALALLLATVGLFGLLAFTVAQRTREVGIRMALGARANDVVRIVLADGMRVTLAGALIGLLGGAAVSRTFSALLYGMSPLDPIAYGSVLLTVLTVALAACYVPVRRAARVDPLVALKAE
jgi:predicted permease